MSTLIHPIYLPADLLEALAQRTGHFWSCPENEAVVVEAVRSLLNPEPAAPVQQPAAQSEAGYQWKQVFLPEGTRLRASFGGQPYFAHVEGAQVKYGAHAISPSCFANLYGSGNRNAWKAVWLRFPGSDDWLLADICRCARQAAIARMKGDDPIPTRRPANANASTRRSKREQERRGSGAVRTVAGKKNGAPGRPAAEREAGFALEEKARNEHVSRRGSRRKRRAAKHAPGIRQ